MFEPRVENGVSIDMDGLSGGAGGVALSNESILSLPRVLRVFLGMEVEEIVIPNWDGEGRSKMIWVRRPLEKMVLEWQEEIDGTRKAARKADGTVVEGGPRFILHGVPSPLFHALFDSVSSDPSRLRNDWLEANIVRNKIRAAFENYWREHKDKPLKGCALTGGVDGTVISFGKPRRVNPTSDLANFTADFVNKHFKNDGSPTFMRVQEAFLKFADQLLRDDFEWWKRMGMKVESLTEDRTFPTPVPPDYSDLVTPKDYLRSHGLTEEQADEIISIKEDVFGAPHTLVKCVPVTADMVGTFSTVEIGIDEAKEYRKIADEHMKAMEKHGVFDRIEESLAQPASLPDSWSGVPVVREDATTCRCKSLLNGHEATCTLARKPG